MATAPDPDGGDVIDNFLSRRGHDTDDGVAWDRSHNKKQCPDCAALHDLSASRCSVCDWTPE